VFSAPCHSLLFSSSVISRYSVPPTVIQLSYRHPLSVSFSVDANKENGCLFCAPCHLGLLLLRERSARYRTVIQLRVLVRFLLTPTKKTDSFSALHAIWVCCATAGAVVISSCPYHVFQHFDLVTSEYRRLISSHRGISQVLCNLVPCISRVPCILVPCFHNSILIGRTIVDPSFGRTLLCSYRRVF
jgi:hypothetical protein